MRGGRGHEVTRRRILAVVPIFLIALLVQGYAPAGSARAIGRAHQQAVAPPCPMHAHQPTAPRETPHAPGAVCDLCDFVFSGAAPVAFDIPQVRIDAVAPFRIAGPLPEARVFASPRREAAQARAPPSAS